MAEILPRVGIEPFSGVQIQSVTHGQRREPFRDVFPFGHARLSHALPPELRLIQRPEPVGKVENRIIGKAILRPGLRSPPC